MFDSYKDCLPEKYRKFPNFFRRSNTVFHARILYIKLTLSWFLSTTTVKNYFTIFLKSKVSEFLKTLLFYEQKPYKNNPAEICPCEFLYLQD